MAKYTTPYLLQYKDVDILSTVMYNVSRKNKKPYAIVNYGDDEYNHKSNKVSSIEHLTMSWALAPIMEMAMEWQGLDSHFEALEENYNEKKMPGIIYHPEIVEKKLLANKKLRTKVTQSWFEFDPDNISLDGVNLFLKPINGSIRLW